MITLNIKDSNDYLVCTSEIMLFDQIKLFDRINNWALNILNQMKKNIKLFYLKIQQLH